MNTGRVLYQTVKADFLERVRRYSYLVTLAATIFLAYNVATGQLRVSLDGYRGVYNSAWIGAVMTLITGTFLCLAGFYVVKNGIMRDQQTRVGQILAATPLSKPMYTLAKAASNFVVLASMVAVLALSGIAMQLFMGEDRHIQLSKIFVPIAVVALPAMFFIAGVAILFETIPGLRGGIGNVAAFFLFVWGIAAGANRWAFDVLGLGIFANQLSSAVRAVYPAYKNGFTIGNDGRPTLGTFVYQGFTVDADIVLTRLLVVLAGFGCAMLAAMFFHRFDPARQGSPTEGLLARLRRHASPSSDGYGNNGNIKPLNVHLTPITPVAASFNFGSLRFFPMYRAELALMLKGRSRWWYLIAAGLLIATLANPLPDTLKVLSVTWLWPMFIWSKLGTRDSIFNTEKILFSSPHANLRQLPATWAAAITIALVFAGGVIAKLVMARDGRGLFVVLVGAMLVPSFALACGTLTKTAKLFEALYIVAWYTGPMQPAPLIDYTGASKALRASNQPEQLLMVVVICIAVTFLARQKSFWQHLLSKPALGQ